MMFCLRKYKYNNVFCKKKKKEKNKYKNKKKKKKDKKNAFYK